MSSVIGARNESETTMGNEIVEAIKELVAVLEEVKQELHALRRAVERRK